MKSNNYRYDVHLSAARAQGVMYTSTKARTVAAGVAPSCRPIGTGGRSVGA